MNGPTDHAARPGLAASLAGAWRRLRLRLATGAATGRRERETPDTRLLRRVGRRLVAWSSVITLAVLVVVGAAFYTVVANAVRQNSVDQLDERAGFLEAAMMRVRDNPFRPGVRLPIGAILGGPGSGTFAVVVTPSGQVLDLSNEATGLPVAVAVDAARTGSRDIREVDVASTPIRVLTDPVTLADGSTAVVQVAQDISLEASTLSTLRIVLVGGALLALVVAALAGMAYANRALVPIRESLRRQREFAADASHELRTPLTVVRSNVEYLERHPEARVADVREVVADVREEVDRMTGLVEDLLLLARTDSGAIEIEPGPMDLGLAATEALASLGPVAAARGVRLSPDVAPAPIVGDAGRIRQLARILLDNAIKHSPPGAAVRLGVRPRSSGATLVIEDDGPGIAPADLPHVFERFWRAPDAPAGGTGLGLAIAEWIVDRHGGTITAGNHEPHGARFEVVLPAARA